MLALAAANPPPGRRKLCEYPCLEKMGQGAGCAGGRVEGSSPFGGFPVRGRGLGYSASWLLQNPVNAPLVLVCADDSAAASDGLPRRRGLCRQPWVLIPAAEARVFDALQGMDLEGHGPLEVRYRRGGREASSPFI